jgi:hypothetical protein
MKPTLTSSFTRIGPLLLASGILTASAFASWALAQSSGQLKTDHAVAYPMPPELMGVDLLKQTDEQAAAKSTGCLTCHVGSRDPHFKATLRLGCVDCHGGRPDTCVKEQAHVMPRFPDAWRSAANPIRTYTLLNHEEPEFIRFINPGDLRIAHISCGTTSCHPKEVLQNRKSMMTHGCMLWGAALYNNGAVPEKHSRYGESWKSRAGRARD